MVVVAIAQGLGAATVGAAGLALLTIEGPKTVMIIADYIRKRWVIPLEEKQRAEAARINAETEAFLAKKREENIQEGREEGMEQMQSQWQAWNERRLAAEANGEPFDEPPPGGA